MNGLKTFILMLLMTILLVSIGNLISGKQGMITAFIFAFFMNFISYWFSDKIVLAMYGAKEIKENALPQVRSIVQQLTSSQGLPMPKIYLINSPMPNAFATGRNPKHSAVAVTSGILDLLDEKELSGVIAHELSHVKNRDILIGTVAATLAGAIFMLARMAQFAAMFGGGGGRGRENNGGPLGMLIVAIVAPFAAMIIQMAISRQREYQADASGAKMLGDPLALASALRKLAVGVKRNPVQVNPTTAHMFIVSPFSGKSLFTLFSTHPPLEERIKRLESMAQEAKGYKIPKIVY
ncbi:MAG: zinc metalloprotease HtpX [Elusimicrobia bacterium]|nr:zinc metalloprotease HtpX [Elusimicrobiota bacterium]